MNSYFNGTGKHQKALDDLRVGNPAQEHVKRAKEQYTLYIAHKFNALTNWQKQRFVVFFGEESLNDAKQLEAIFDKLIVEAGKVA